MNGMKKREQGILWAAGIVFLLIFSYMTSPLFPYAHGWDSAFFQLVGAGMTRGYLPYRDFFDMKGPWLFFGEYIGQLLWYGKGGVFLMQCLSMGVAIWFCRKTYARFFGGKGIRKHLMVLLPLFVIMAVTMEGGNLTEEWSLPFLFGALYLALDFIKGQEQEHNPGYAFVYGICFGILALIRITNAVMICAIVFTITVFLIIGRRWKNLLWNAIAFLGGIAAAFVPPLLYYGYFGEVKEMLYCTFVFGFIYGTEGFALGTGMLLFTTLFFALFVLGITGERNRRLWTLVIVNTMGLCITLGMGSSTLHDYMLLIPEVMLGVWQLAGCWEEKRLKKQRKLLVVAALVFCFAYPLYKLPGTAVTVLHQFNDRTVWDHVMETAGCIPEEERDSVLGYEVPMRWYSIADIMPYSKYCGWQEHYMKLSPQIEDEIARMMRDEPPKWIVTKEDAVLENEMMIHELRENYIVVKQNEDFVLYKKLDRMSEAGREENDDYECFGISGSVYTARSAENCFY